MREIKTYSKGAPFYNAFIGTWTVLVLTQDCSYRTMLKNRSRFSVQRQTMHRTCVALSLLLLTTSTLAQTKSPAKKSGSSAPMTATVVTLGAEK